MGNTLPLKENNTIETNQRGVFGSAQKQQLPTVVDFQKLLKGQKSAVDAASLALQNQGWFFLSAPSLFYSTMDPWKFKEVMPDNPTVVSTEEISALEKFFASNLDEKLSYSEKFSFGYSTVDHKEGLHLYTGFRAYHHKIPPGLKNLVLKWTSIDDVMLTLIEVLCQKVFGCDAPTVCHRADLPVAYASHFGLLDVAHYFNNKTVSTPPNMGESTEEVNCVPHYDPGLFSISFLSTSEGLQLQDPLTGQWFDGPVNTRPGQENLVVVWAGEAAVRASHGKVKAGIHRVIYPTDSPKPRITAWYELCTLDQANEPSNILQTPGEMVLEGLPESKPLQVEAGDTTLSLFRKIERDYGVPMSKVMRRGDNFRAYYSKEKPAVQQNKS